MTFDRIFAMPNSHTFKMLPVKEILDWYCKPYLKIVDPFARDSIYAAHYSNDLNPTFKTAYQMEATEFLDLMIVKQERFDIALLDPPYSPRQISEAYQQIGRKVTGQDTQNARLYKACKDRLTTLLKDNGIAISFGWNSGGFGITRGFELLHIRLIYHGAAHNDTIVTIEKKCFSQTTI